MGQSVFERSQFLTDSDSKENLFCNLYILLFNITINVIRWLNPLAWKEEK